MAKKKAASQAVGPATPLTVSEIDRIERELGHTLPPFYRRLLRANGPGPIGKHGHLYDPLITRGMYAIFDQPDDLFGRYFPFGYQVRKDQLWLIDIALDKAATMWFQSAPDCEDDDWLDYETWLRNNLPDWNDTPQSSQ